MPAQKDTLLAQSNTAEAFGIKVVDLNHALLKQYGYPSGIEGVVMVDVDPGSRAATKGLQIGDLIVEINGQKIVNIQNYKEIMDRVIKSKKEKILLHIVRSQEYSYVVLPLK